MALLASTTTSSTAAAAATRQQAAACPVRRVPAPSARRMPLSIPTAAAVCSTSGRAAALVPRASRADSAADMARWEQQVRDGSVANVSVKQAGECVLVCVRACAHAWSCLVPALSCSADSLFSLSVLPKCRLCHALDPRNLARPPPLHSTFSQPCHYLCCLPLQSTSSTRAGCCWMCAHQERLTR
jgi:hypothetical protein